MEAALLTLEVLGAVVALIIFFSLLFAGNLTIKAMKERFWWF